MSYRLAIDVGNTTQKFALFLDRNLEVIEKVHKDFDVGPILNYLDTFPISSCIVSASGNVSPTLVNWLHRMPFDVLHFDYKTPSPLGILYSTPSTLGKDRLASAIGSLRYFPNGNTIIVDLGTCITMNMIDETPAFVGGNISPGLSMRLEAMHHFTAKLPLVEKQYTGTLIGVDTESAIQNGAILGAFWEIESFIHKIQAKNASVNVILTGGDADFFVSYTNIKIFATPNLVLEGLNEILIFNAL